MPVEIDDSDEISRCIIYSRFFQNDIHVDELLWQFGPTRDDGASHESAVLRRLAPEPADVHRIGCKIAAAQNERMGQPDPGPKRRYYCGFRTAAYASLPREGEGFKIVWTNHPEGGEDAHVDVALFVLVEGKSAKAVKRTEAGLAIAEQFGPPEPHRCHADEADDQHPFSIHGETCLTSGLRERWPALDLAPIINGSSQDLDEPGFLQ